MYKHYYLNKWIQLELRVIFYMFCDGVAIEIFRVTAERSEETLQQWK